MKLNKTARNAIRYIVMLFALVVFGYSSYHLADIYLSYQEGKDTYKDIESQFMIPITGDSGNISGEVETDENGFTISISDSGKEFQFDYAALKRLNKDAVGWIKLSGGEYISYPIVKGEDNSYYLDHLVNRRYNEAGSLFVDYRCEDVWDSKNVIIYGHRMKNKTMFGTLNYFIDKKNYHIENPYFDIWCGDKQYRYYVYAMFQTNVQTSKAYQIDFESDEEFLAYVNEHRALSKYRIDVGEITADDHIVTLSTCVAATGDERYVVQLVRREIVE